MTSSCTIDSKQPENFKRIQASVREQFPIFRSHPDTIFFDNASTTQKPEEVIESITSFYRESCSNAGRASYSWSTQLSRLIEESRRTVADFINAPQEDIAFTGGATDSLNLVAHCWGLSSLKDGDEILVCPEDHQSATLPWLNVQSLLARFGIHIKIVPFQMHATGTYDRKSIREGLSARTRLIALSHIHHLYGMEMDLPELRDIIPQQVFISLDASQSIGHTAVDVEKLGVQFLSFSGHKMLASNGTGILWVATDLLPLVSPMRVGAKGSARLGAGGYEIDRSTLSGLVECGTQNLPGILSLRPAVRFINSLGIENVERHLSDLTRYLHQQLKTLPGVEFAPGPGVCGCTHGYGILGFRLEEIASRDLADYLSSENIFVRSGDHCISSGHSGDDYIRVSMHVYNLFEEIDRFVEVIRNATG